MVETANPKRLSHRIFYDRPSTGPNREWFDAVKQGNLEKVKQMVTNGQNIEVKDTGALGQTALGWAAFIGDQDMVDYLLSQHADIHATDRVDVSNVLKSAVLGNNVNIVKQMYGLLKDEVDVNDQSKDNEGETLLMVAASNNRIETVKYLISLGANVNLVTTIKNKFSRAYDKDALIYACERNFTEMQSLLIANGAINHRTGRPACH